MDLEHHHEDVGALGPLAGLDGCDLIGLDTYHDSPQTSQLRPADRKPGSPPASSDDRGGTVRGDREPVRVADNAAVERQGNEWR